LTIFDEIFAKFFVFRGTSCRMPNFTQKMISVGILAAVFLFLLGSLQQHYSTTFLPITWAPGVRIQPSKDHFEALFQRNAFLQSSTLVDSFQPAGRADWPPDPWHLLGHFGSFPPPTHATPFPKFFSVLGQLLEGWISCFGSKISSILDILPPRSCGLP
jgi:hypothetical protein